MLARRLDISVSYLSQLESDSRPLTIPILLTLSRDFGLDLDSLQTHDTPRLAASLREALGDPLFADDPAGLQDIQRAVAQARSSRAAPCIFTAPIPHLLTGCQSRTTLSPAHVLTPYARVGDRGTNESSA